jgi:hypothetical protein
MSAPRLITWSVTLAALSGLASGCATSTAPRESVLPYTSQRSPALTQSADRTVLRPGMEAEWSVQSTKSPPSRSMAGRSVVGPDGTMELGPYGSVRVAGLTVQQAQTAVAKQVSHYVTSPQVALVVNDPAARGGVTGVARAPVSGAPVQAAYRSEKSAPVVTANPNEPAGSRGPSTTTWSAWQPPSPGPALPEPAPAAQPAASPSLSQRLAGLFHRGDAKTNP